MNYLKFFWKSIIWAIVVLILSVINTGDVDKTGFLNIPQMDKIVHFVLYMVLSFFIIRDLKDSGLTGDSQKVIILSAAVASTVFGGGMELLQSIPQLHRSADITDFFANMAGSAAAVIFFKRLNQIVRNVFNIADN